MTLEIKIISLLSKSLQIYYILPFILYFVILNLNFCLFGGLAMVFKLFKSTFQY